MSRKGENIYKRKDGRWEGRFIKRYEPTGKAKYGYVYAKSYKEVKSKLEVAKINNSQFNDTNDVTYCELLDKWLACKKREVKYSSFIRYKNTIENHIKPELGNMKVKSISAEILQEYLKVKSENGRIDKTGGLSNKSLSDILVIIKETLKFGNVYDTSIINLKATASQKHKSMRVLNEREQTSLTVTLLNNTDIYKMGVLICLYTGIRIGELCALKWSDISLESKVISINKTLQRLPNTNPEANTKTTLFTSEPKSDSGNRTIPIPEFLYTIILPFRKQDEMNVISTEKKPLIEPRTMQNYFKKYLAESNISDANFHSLRHTFATRCIEVGFDIKTLSEILGHSSVKITLDRYVHSSLNLKKLNMQKLKFAV